MMAYSPDASAINPLLHYTPRPMGQCAAGRSCCHGSGEHIPQIQTNTFDIAVVSRPQPGAPCLSAFCSPECFVKNCGGCTEGEAGPQPSAWQHSCTWAHQKQRCEQRQQSEQRRLLDAAVVSSAGDSTAKRVPTGSSVPPSTSTTILRALPFLKRKLHPGADKELPPAKRMNGDAQNNAAEAEAPPAALPARPPPPLVPTVGTLGPTAISMTRSTHERFQYMQELLNAKTTQSWIVSDKQRTKCGFAAAAVKKQLQWWVLDDGLGRGEGLLLADACFDTLMALKREGWGPDDKRAPSRH